MLDQSNPKETPEYKEGRQALQEGLSEIINPYAKKTNEYRLWHLGWLHASINKKVGHILEKYGQELM
jgi:hypothetical protein